MRRVNANTLAPCWSPNLKDRGITTLKPIVIFILKQIELHFFHKTSQPINFLKGDAPTDTGEVSAVRIQIQ